MEKNNKTPFSTIYDSFYGRITDTMYMELTEEDTCSLLQELLINALPRFEFPRFDVFDYEEGFLASGAYCGVESNFVTVPSTYWVGGFFNTPLTTEEINILSLLMVIEWYGQQLATTENTRLKYSGSDFKFTSQANHMSKLKVMIDKAEQESLHMQRLYKRRKNTTNGMLSTFGQIMSTPSYGYKI